MRVFFHIGAGKTGTSSVQGTLLKSDAILQNQGVKYLGLMLEHAPVKLFDWQKASATKEFLALDEKEAEIQVEKVLGESIKLLENSGIHTLVWSNEWFFGRHSGVLNPMKRLEKAGHDVRVIGYVRRHDAWAKSAYSQWGVKHKTYKGNIIPFREYIKRRPVAFAGAFLPWANFFGDKFLLRNFDYVGDVVDDFIDVLGVDKELVNVDRVNETPGPEEFAMRAIFNDKRPGDVMPHNFERLFQAVNINFKRNPSEWINELLPSKEDLKEVVEATRDDQDKINNLLLERGQPVLSFEDKEVKPFSINADVAISALFQIIERQAVRINKLQRDIDDLRSSVR